jgi:hypothetical protein
MSWARRSRKLPKALLHAFGASRDYSANVYVARCPLHRGAVRLILLTLSAPQTLLLVCERGCPEARILERLELPTTTLRPWSKARASCEAIYPYTDAEGTPVFEVLRWTPKRFSVRGSAARVLYQLPELVQAPPERPVFLVEGEKDVETLRRRGLLATTSPLGAHQWHETYAHWFIGRLVIILPDHDAAGAAYAEAVRRSLDAVAREVRVVALPGLSHKEDVSDWLADGHTTEDLLLVTGLATPSTARERLGRVELAVLRAVQASQRRGNRWVRRDELPARVFGWVPDGRPQRTAPAALQYTTVDRVRYRRGQASLSCALASLVQKGLLRRHGAKEYRCTVRATTALNLHAESGMPPENLTCEYSTT